MARSPLPFLFGEQGYLEQVLVNLLDNAIKYSREEEKSESPPWKEIRRRF
jgi:signal transduction histidine kinase